MIKINKYIQIDEATHILIFKSARIKLVKCQPKKEYLEPFIDTEEPDVWVMIKGKEVVVRIGKDYFCGSM